MSTQETKFGYKSYMTADQARRRAEELRAEQFAQLSRGLFKLIAKGYSKLVSRSAKLNIPARSYRGLS